MNNATSSSFQIKHLGDLLTSAIDCPHSTPVWTDSGKLVLRNFNIRNGRLNLSNLSYTDIKTYQSRNRRATPEAGDIIITREAPMGEAALLPTDFNCCLGQRMVLLKVSKDVCDPQYLLYALLSNYVQQQIDRHDASGSIVSNLCLPDLKELKIPYYDLHTQIKIANILSAIDRKIDVAQNTITELESAAKLIYDYWYTQFDFPDENGNPYRSSGGKMTYSEELNREIPEGWEVTYLEKLLAAIPKTDRISSSDYLSSGLFPVVDQGKSIVAGYTDNENAVLDSGSGYIVFGDHTRAIKYIRFPFARGADGTKVLKSSNTRVPDELLFQMVNSIDLSNYGYARHYKFLKDQRVFIPAAGIGAKYSAIMSPLHTACTKLLFENQQLELMRDWLLPMLMNGQITIVTEM